MKKYKNNAAAASNYEKLDTNPDTEQFREKR